MAFKNVNRKFNVLASAARTATTTSRPLRNDNGSAVRIRLAVTAITADASITFKVQGRDAAGAWYDLLTSAAVTTVSTNTIVVGRGLPATANVSANALVPSQFRVVVTHADAKSVTYSVTAEVFA
jgi:hypothetical protein